MQVQIELTSVSAIWAYDIRDASDAIWAANAGISTATTTETTPWLDASGTYTITIACIGSLEGSVIVFARGVPFITA